MIGPNPAAAFNRGSQCECILDACIDTLFELSTLVFVLGGFAAVVLGLATNLSGGGRQIRDESGKLEGGIQCP
jgi:hypothetical protein